MQLVALNNALWLLCHCILAVAPAAAKHADATQALKIHAGQFSAKEEVVVASDSTPTPQFLDSSGKGNAIVASDGMVTMPLSAVQVGAGVRRHEALANGPKRAVVRAQMLTPSSALQRTGSSTTFVMLGDNLHTMTFELDELTKLRRELQKQAAVSKEGQPGAPQPNAWEARLQAIGDKTDALEAKLQLHAKSMVKLGLMNGELDKLEQTKKDKQPENVAERLQAIDEMIVKLQGKLQHQKEMMSRIAAMDDEIDSLEQSKKDKTGTGSTKVVDGPSATKTRDTEETGDTEKTGDTTGAGVKTRVNEDAGDTSGAGVKTGHTERTKGDTTAETTDTIGDTTGAGHNAKTGKTTPEDKPTVGDTSGPGDKATTGKTTPEDKPTATGGHETETPQAVNGTLTGIPDDLDVKDGTSAVGVSLIVVTLWSLVFSGNFH